MTFEEALDRAQKFMATAESPRDVEFWMLVVNGIQAHLVYANEAADYRRRYMADAEWELEEKARRKAQATLESKVLPGLRKLVSDLRISRWDFYEDEDYR